MAYAAIDYQKLVEKYINSPEGRKFMKEQKNINVGYTEAEMKRIAENLKRDIITAFLYATKEPSAIFDDGQVSVLNNGSANGFTTIRILFHDKALSRPSLWDSIKDSWPSENVYDIIGLFTQGYAAKDYAYGEWAHHDGDYYTNVTDDTDGSFIRSRKERAANDFVNKVIGKYKVLYPDIDIKYPRRWGGTEPDTYRDPV